MTNEVLILMTQDGQRSATTYESIIVQSDGTSWRIYGQYLAI